MTHESATRKLAAILAADVADYTRLMEADEEATLAAWWNARKTVIDPSIEKHSGRIVKHTGDGFLAEFPTATQAVQCAIAMQTALADSGTDIPKHGRFEFRMGINVGEIVADDEDIYGDGVNIAARIESLAEPGGLCVSANVREQVHKKLDIEFRDIGRQLLKNVSDPVHIYRVGLDSGVEDRLDAKPEVTLTLPDKPSLAVLPFTSMSPDPEQEYFADGVTEDIITALSNVQSFFVIARNSTFTFKGQAVDVKQVGRDLGVRYVMEGSVRRAGNRIRITAQLVDATTGNHLWADRFDRSLEDVFELQDEVTASVVGAIEPHLNRAEFERIREKRPESLDAYDYTLRGLATMNKLTPGDTADALALFRKAIEADSSYARAHVCASWCYRRHVQLRGMTLSEEDRAESIRLAEIALKLDGTDPYVLWQAGITAGLVAGDFETMTTLVERSVAINANSTRAWSTSGILRCILGQPDRAIADAQRAIRLSPLDPSMWVPYGILANAHMQQTHYEEAMSWAKKSVAQHRFNLPAYHVLAASYVYLGQQTEAEDAVNQLRELDPELTIGRLQQIYPVTLYVNLEVFLKGLHKAGLPE